MAQTLRLLAPKAINDPVYFKQSYQRYQNASARDVIQTSKDWLSDGEYTLRVLPYAKHTTTPSTVDRSKGVPGPGKAPDVSFDRLKKATLSNGLNIILAERPAIPVVNMRLLFDAGFAADKGFKSGTANLTMSMLDEGTKNLDALQISTKLSEIGTSIRSGVSLDSSTVSLNTLKETLTTSMSLFSDIVLNPSFPNKELERLKQQQIAAISQEKSSPFGVGFRLLPTLLYGEGHAYSAPFSGSGDEASVAAINTDDLKRYHQTWFKANNATLIVTGDITLEELVPLAEKHLSKLPSGNVPTKNIAARPDRQESVVYLLDRPDSEQSAIISADMLPKFGFDGELPLQLMNEVLGASFNSRINMNLREDKGWSYGARSIIRGTQAERPFIVYASVQSDKTADSMLEVHKELSAIIDNRPASSGELDRSLNKRTLTLPGRWETASSIASDISTLVRYDLDESYWDTYVNKLRNISLEQVNASAQKHISPDKMLWLIVGDRSKVEQSIRKANLGKLIVIDAQGNEVE